MEIMLTRAENIDKVGIVFTRASDGVTVGIVRD